MSNSKSALQKLLKTDSHYSTDLVTLDFKSQSLNKYLQNVTSIINQHSHKINDLEMKKITIEEIRLGNIDMINSMKLPTILEKQINFGKIQDKFNTVDSTYNGIKLNFNKYQNGLQYIMDQIKKQNTKINSLNDSLTNFQTIDNTKQIVRKAQVQSKKFTEDQISKILTRLNDLEMNTNKKLNNFENLTKQMQKKTLWKITQCQQNLMKKITPEYVDKALQQFQTQIIFKIQNNKNQQVNDLKYTTQYLKSKLEHLSKQYQSSQKQNKNSIKQLLQSCRTFQTKQKLQKDFKQVQSKFKQFLIKIDKLQKRQHPQDLQFRIMKITSQHGQKLNTHTDKIKKLDIELNSINNIMSSMGGGQGGLGIDPHKLCQLDGEIRQLKDGLRTVQGKLTTVEDQLRTKMLVFEERIMTTLSMIKGQDHFVSREEMYQSISRLRDPVNDRLNEQQNLMNQLNAKMTKLQIFEKYTKKKIKQMTRGDQLNKILDLKMNIGQAESHFSAMNMKMQALQIIMNKIKMQMESNSDFLRMLQRQINQPQQGINVLIPKTKVFPAKCIPCGTKHIPQFDNNMMQGSDGKLYKVDMKQYPSGDKRQVYAVTQNQLAMFDSPMKNSNVKTRPTSGKTINVRTSSSKYF